MLPPFFQVAPLSSTYIAGTRSEIAGRHQCGYFWCLQPVSLPIDGTMCHYWLWNIWRSPAAVVYNICFPMSVLSFITLLGTHTYTATTKGQVTFISALLSSAIPGFYKWRREISKRLSWQGCNLVKLINPHINHYCLHDLCQRLIVSFFLHFLLVTSLSSSHSISFINCK